MKYEIVRTPEEVDSLLNQAAEVEFEGSKYPGMTFEQGILEAVDWLLGYQNEYPLGEPDER